MKRRGFLKGLGGLAAGLAVGVGFKPSAPTVRVTASWLANQPKAIAKKVVEFGVRDPVMDAWHVPIGSMMTEMNTMTRYVLSGRDPDGKAIWERVG